MKLEEEWSDHWFQFILEHPEKEWNWEWISWNTNITWDKP